MMNPFEEKIRRLCCTVCVFVSTSSFAKAEDVTSLIQGISDFRFYSKALHAGTATSAQAGKAAEGIDKVGSAASGLSATMLAVENPIAAAPSAAIGAALIPLAKDVGSHLGELTSITNKANEMSARHDYSQMAELDNEQNAIKHRNASWDPDYGDTWDTIGRLVGGVSLEATNSIAYGVKKSLESVANALSDMRATKPAENKRTPNMAASSAPDACLGADGCQSGANKSAEMWRLVSVRSKDGSGVESTQIGSARQSETVCHPMTVSIDKIVPPDEHFQRQPGCVKKDDQKLGDTGYHVSYLCSKDAMKVFTDFQFSVAEFKYKSSIVTSMMLNNQIISTVLDETVYEKCVP